MKVTIDLASLGLVTRMSIAEEIDDLSVLEKLSNDPSYGVRAKVGSNIFSSKKILEKLADDENWEVRLAVAKNKKTSEPLLNKLSNDADYEVVEAAKKNLQK
jgi:hypothetical protein